MIPFKGFSQSGDICNLNAVKAVNQHINKLSDRMCLEFLMAINTNCTNNVEFQEYSNETIFNILAKNPLILCKTIDKHKSKINNELVFRMVSDPISDQIDLIMIKNEIKKLKYSGKSKQELIKSIDEAVAKLNPENQHRTY